MPTPIIVTCGQSNAGGAGVYSQIANYAALGLDQPFDAVQYIDKVAPDNVDPPVFVSRGPIALQARPDQGCGIELSFGRRLIELGFPHAQFKEAIWSSRLDTNWMPDASYPSVGSNLFTTFNEDLQAAEVSLGGYIAGFNWIQGEADAGVNGPSHAYAANLTTFIAALREHWPDTWFVFNRLHTNAGINFDDVVQAQQEYVAATVPKTRMIDSEPYELNGAHFTSQSYYDLGLRFADVWADIWKPAAPGPRSRRRSMFTTKQSDPRDDERTFYFTAVQSADLQERMTGISSFTVRVKKPGAADAAAANAPVEVNSSTQEGVYSFTLTANEADTPGYGMINITATSMEPREFPFYVEPAKFGKVVAGTLGASAFTTDLDDADDTHKDTLISFISGTLAGQVKKVGAFVNSSGLVTLATVGGTQQAFTAAPSVDDDFEIIRR